MTPFEYLLVMMLANITSLVTDGGISTMWRFVSWTALLGSMWATRPRSGDK